MKSGLRYLVPSLILAGWLSTIGQSAAASTNPKPTLTIQVINSAHVKEKTVIKAEEIAARIFKKVGIEIRWTDASLLIGHTREESVAQDPSNLSPIWLNIIPEGFRISGIHKTIMGLAPGAGPNRNLVYVFYDRIETIARQLIGARLRGSYYRPATLSQILAHAIAHEVGHLLLNLEVHSGKGIMRGDWNPEDLDDMAYEKFFFTSQEARVIRAEVSRRIAHLFKLPLISGHGKPLGSKN